MFNPQKREFTSKNLRLPLSLVNRMSKLAQQKNMSFNALVVECCEYALNDLAKESPENEETK